MTVTFLKELVMFFTYVKSRMPSLAFSCRTKSVNWKIGEFIFTVGLIRNILYVTFRATRKLGGGHLVQISQSESGRGRVPFKIEERRLLLRILAVSTCRHSGN